MLIVKKCEDRAPQQGEYLVQLNNYIDINDCRPGVLEPRNSFGYYCDKAHLRHMYLALRKEFEDESLAVENDRLRKGLDDSNRMFEKAMSMLKEMERVLHPLGIRG